MANMHHLKTLDIYFDAIKDGRKKFEARLNDRAFQTGDTLRLVRINDSGFYTNGGRDILIRRISYILQGGQFGIEPRYCVLGLEEIGPPEPQQASAEQSSTGIASSSDLGSSPSLTRGSTTYDRLENVAWRWRRSALEPWVLVHSKPVPDGREIEPLFARRQESPDA